MTQSSPLGARGATPAVIMSSMGASLSFEDVDARSLTLARRLSAAGLRPGDHMAVLMENQLGYFEACWAGLRSGLYIAPINWHLTPDEVAYIAADSGARALITSHALRAVATGVAASLSEDVLKIMVDGGAAGYEDCDGADTRDDPSAQPPELEIAADPAVRGLDALIGSSAHAGLRRRLPGLAMFLRADRSLALRILHDVPAVTTLSRLASIHAADVPYPVQAALTSGGEGRVDVSAGSAAGSTMNGLVAARVSPVRDHADPAAPGPDPDDCLSWHRSPPRARVFPPAPPSRRWPCGPNRCRRRARPFRDGRHVPRHVVGADGTERVEHEYRLRTLVNRDSGIIVASEAVPVQLPAPECPRAAASSSLLVGRPVSDLSASRWDLVGPSTCTHLTQALLAYADAAGLVAVLSAA